jgi:hypothetical protein
MQTMIRVRRWTCLGLLWSLSTTRGFEPGWKRSRRAVLEGALRDSFGRLGERAELTVVREHRHRRDEAIDRRLATVKANDPDYVFQSHIDVAPATSGA